MIPTHLSILSILLILLTLSPSVVRAQATDTGHTKSFSILAGVSQFDLSGTGVTPFVSGRVDGELTRWLLVEGGLSAMRPSEQFRVRSTYLIPEVQLQVQAPFEAVRPYIGIGQGMIAAVSAGRGMEMTLTVTAATGVRIPLPNRRMALRGELRVRGIGSSFNASAAEWTGGLAWGF